jgi:hypothetical protein
VFHKEQPHRADRMSVLDVDPERVTIRTSDGPGWYAASMVREHAREELPT